MKRFLEREVGRLNSFPLNQQYLRQIFENIQDGIIIMSHNRKILLMNPSARNLTGWLPNDYVPYCTFCQQRKLERGENQCYLIAREEIPYFLSEMPTYHGKKINVEMSTALIYDDKKSGEKEYLLVLRDQSMKQKEEEARLSKMIIHKLIEAKENEHKRLAQELHDGVGQSLYTISVALEAMEAFLQNPKLQNYIDEVRQELTRVMNDVKDYSYELRPQSLDGLGLIAAIRDLISKIEKNNSAIKTSFVSNFDYRLSPIIEINLYRVAQEAVHNIIKYAMARTIFIELKEYQHKIEMTIRDDGIGFNIASVLKTGLGLKHMEERMNQLGGSCSIHSQCGKGTIVNASVPKGEIFL
ncbi:ATPase (plasmid) [Priestia endophytica]|nr:ATPase [Priestia endophytica]